MAAADNPAWTAASDPLADVRATTPAERLLEDSWSSRSASRPGRELLAESAAAAAFLATAIPLAIFASSGRPLDLALCAVLVGAYGTLSRLVRFPIGAGTVVPSYLVLAPMLLLLPPELVPLLVALGLTLASAVRFCTHQAKSHEMLFAIPDAWHSVGPSLIFVIAASSHGSGRAALYVAAFGVACITDLASSTIREYLAGGATPRLQVHVLLRSWLFDLCVAPLGFAIGEAARHEPSALLLLVPVTGLMKLADRDRTARIEQAQTRLEILAHERTRLQSAVRHLGDALAAKLDLTALANVLLRGSLDALDAQAGRIELDPPGCKRVEAAIANPELTVLLNSTIDTARARGTRTLLQAGASAAIAIPIDLGAGGVGALALARLQRPYSVDEQTLLASLVDSATVAANEIIAHEQLHEQARTDPLTRLGNRRKFAETLDEQLSAATVDHPLHLMLFDLDGFKPYNDRFGHPAGDALLVRLGGRLREAVAPHGSAYRLGGDEFCVLMPAEAHHSEQLARVAGALCERGPQIEIQTSCGSVLLPQEAHTAGAAMRLADRRLYGDKRERASAVRQAGAPAR